MEAFVSAGEHSGDRHAAETVRELNRRIPGLRWFGIAGPALREVGVEPWIPMEELNRMGTTEVLSALPKMAAILRRARQECFARRPGLMLVVDSPDFNLRLIRGFRASGIPVFYLAPPKAWAWRKSRTRILAREVTQVLSLFRFEHEFYQAAGCRSAFVGNPLYERLEAIRGTLERVPSRIAVLPGSRGGELERHVPIVLDVVRALKAARPSLDFHIPVPQISAALRAELAKVATVYEKPSQEGSWQELARCEAALVKSGTSTLEAALLGTPHVVFYKPAPLTQFVFDRFVSYRGPIGLSNVVASKALGVEGAHYPECVGQDLSGPVLEAMRKILSGGDALAQAEVLRQKIVSQVHAGPGTAAEAAASEIQASLHGNRPRIYGQPALRPLTWAASVTWSSANSLRRAWPTAVPRIPARVVSVGNLQAGGAGKTPIVARLAREAIEREQRVLILSRGYKAAAEKAGAIVRAGDEPADPAVCGDEVALLQHLVPGAWIGVGARRLEQYRRIEAEGFRPDLVILDDGFQYRGVQKDLELLAVTSLRPSEYPFREFSGQAARADLALWTKGDQRPRALDLAKEWASVEYGLPTAQGEKVVLVTGVGHGGYVRAQLERAGFEVTRHLQLRDHATPSLLLVHEVAELCKASGSKLGLTGKDWVKWRRVLPQDASLLVFEPELRFLERREAWDRVLWGS